MSQIQINRSERKRNRPPERMEPQKVFRSQTPKRLTKMAQDISEELVWGLQEKDSQDHRSRSKKTKKNSDREAEKVAQEKAKQEEWKRKKKKKREKEAKG